MNESEFESWLDAYGEAWESYDADRVSSLFAADAVYMETPFDRPMRGREEIADYWSNVTRNQFDVEFEYCVLDFDDDRGIAHIDASVTYRPSRQRVTIDGVLLVSFDEDGDCVEFREWWHRRTD